VDLFAEQRLRTCEACHRPFAVQYHFKRLDRSGCERVRSLWIACPAYGCGRRNAALLPDGARGVFAKLIPGVTRPAATAGPGTLRRLAALVPAAAEPRPGSILPRRALLSWLDRVG
jgi:hypothetical protein